MSCCSPADARLELETLHSIVPEEILLGSRDLGDGTRQTDLSVPTMHCGACMAAVEKSLSSLDGVISARVNLSMKRAAVRWRAVEDTVPDLIGSLERIGYRAHLFTLGADAKDTELPRLVRALAVAGFCSMNIMMLSVSVWFGADGQTRQAFHMVSAALALPAILYSGRIFYLSAWAALRHRRTNMDVPVSIGVALAFGLSLYDTAHNAPHAYFDAATTLLFFLLIGRTLEHMMREKARSAVSGLARLSPLGATLIDADGTRRYVPTMAVERGSLLFIAPGDRIPVDGIVETGNSDLDHSLVSGESAPVSAAPGTVVQAGLLNLNGPLTVRATARAEDSFLAQMLRMMEAAEGGRARYRRIADRASALYSPIVHTIALVSLLGWLYATGDWHLSISIAISVLIITCPCALGLAVPIVQVVATARLFERGIMVKDGSALERLAEADAVLFDKTGTLTLGNLCLTNVDVIPPSALGIGAAIAAGSRHPAARAIVVEAAGRSMPTFSFDNLEEVPGLGLEGSAKGSRYRLGRAGWALGRGSEDENCSPMGTAAVLARDGQRLATFLFEDQIRPDAARTVRNLMRAGIASEILSGDRIAVVNAIAMQLGIGRVSAELLPLDKVARVAELARCGKRILMVGDGLNDAPALVAAHVSMAPATAADVGRNAADFVFLKESLSAVNDALIVSRRTGSLIRQNFALAIAYNAIAVPVAIAGSVTPFFAALAMSFSSILVIANATRLRISDAPAAGTRLPSFVRSSVQLGSRP
ncbi:heavy metal translocating P-type ATPase [Mesorhizobium sp. Mes31]|uniref:heavy metal translocating P-type ATPase n=1 Tax=Mesorhizobium sp. Mes31 TaxID=2926017 RepID=UPI0035C7114F